MHGNPWLRLLRREVEALVKRKHGSNYLRERQAKTELGEDQYRTAEPEGQNVKAGKAQGRIDRQPRRVESRALQFRNRNRLVPRNPLLQNREKILHPDGLGNVVIHPGREA